MKDIIVGERVELFDLAWCTVVAVYKNTFVGYIDGIKNPVVVKTATREIIAIIPDDQINQKWIRE